MFRAAAAAPPFCIVATHAAELICFRIDGLKQRFFQCIQHVIGSGELIANATPAHMIPLRLPQTPDVWSNAAPCTWMTTYWPCRHISCSWLPRCGRSCASIGYPAPHKSA